MIPSSSLLLRNNNNEFYDSFHNKKLNVIPRKTKKVIIVHHQQLIPQIDSPPPPPPPPPQKKPKKPKSENFEVFLNDDINFSNVGGYANVKQEMMQIADMLLNHEKYHKYNVRTPKGLLLEGSPGNGKTLLAKAYSGELGICFIPTSGSHFQEKYVGVGSARIRELFDLAKENKPCIIFIDEIDSIGRKRSDDDSSGGGEHGNSLNELLNCMDGFKSTNGVFVIGATNRADLLDPALIRPGRIDKIIHMGLPDDSTRKAVLEIHLKNKPYDDTTIHLDDLIEQTQGLSCAQIENLINEAMLHALRDERESIHQIDLDTVMNRILVGYASIPNVYSNETLYRIAIHELGHALVGHVLPEYSNLKKIILDLNSPHTPGFTLFDTDDNAKIMTKHQLINHLSVLLAGYIAEDVFLNTTSSGVSNDLARCKHLIESMIFDYGMNTQNKVILSQLSELSKEDIDMSINTLTNEAYEHALSIILDHTNVIEKGVELLLSQHQLTRSELETLILRYSV
jgi:cell division protease FtsH